MTSKAEFPELSCYLLPGHTTTPADAIAEAKQAEALGLGKVWVSERFDVKDAGVICSAALAVTDSIHVATGAPIFILATLWCSQRCAALCIICRVGVLS